MDAKNVPSYTASTGEGIPLDTAEGLARAVADLDLRARALSEREAEGVDASRLARLETVTERYLANEFRDYDETNTKRD